MQYDLIKYKSKIESCVKKDFYNFPNEIDDLIQESLIAFHNAAKRIDPTKTDNLFTYCYQQAKWRCYDHIRKLKRRKTVFIEDIQDELLSELPSQYDMETSEVFDNLIQALNICSGTHRRLVLLEIYGIKSTKLQKTLSESTFRRAKKEYKKNYTKLRDNI